MQQLIHLFQTIAFGLQHGCGIRLDSTALCWTTSSSVTYDNTVPAALTNTCFVAVAAGEHHTCAIRCDNGQASCWGRNDAGQLNAPDNMLRALIASGRFSCGIESDTDLLVCWGDVMPELPVNSHAIRSFSCARDSSRSANCPVFAVGTNGCEMSGLPQETPWSSAGGTVSDVTGSGRTYRVYGGCSGDCTSESGMDSSKGMCCGVASADGQMSCYYHGVNVNNMIESSDIGLSQVAVGLQFVCGVRQSDSATECWVPPSIQALPLVSPALSSLVSLSNVASLAPRCAPTAAPTTFSGISASPTTFSLSSAPSAEPSITPTALPSLKPSTSPSMLPSSVPSAVPSSAPSTEPSAAPSTVPSADPSSTPSGQPTQKTSFSPSAQPSSAPSAEPSINPTALPSWKPSASPSILPSSMPSAAPSSAPSTESSAAPSSAPSADPSSTPSGQPTQKTSFSPSAQPSSAPSAQPSITPTALPSSKPSASPSVLPSSMPSAAPSSAPSTEPSAAPNSPAPTTASCVDAASETSECLQLTLQLN